VHIRVVLTVNSLLRSLWLLIRYYGNLALIRKEKEIILKFFIITGIVEGVMHSAFYSNVTDV